MDNVADSEGREAVLFDHNSSVVCSNVNMTSIDSRVETGNDSNDSSTVQQESQQQQQQQQQVVAGQIVSNDVTDTDSSGESFLPVLAPPLFVPDETKRNPSERAKQLQKRLFKLQAEMLEIIQSIHKTGEPMKVPAAAVLYRSKMKARSWRKGTTHTFALRQIEYIERRMQRKMRLAATTNDITLMKRLLKRGVSPNNHDEHGRSPLHISACRGYIDMVRLLLENGADPKQRDCMGNTPLHLAASNCR